MSSFENIFNAAQEGTIDDIKYFIEKKGIDINIKDKNGSTPILLTIHNKNAIEIIKYLLSKGADINADRKSNCFLLSNIYNVEITKILVKSGIDVNAVSDDGYTALHYIKKAEIAKVIVSAKANVNARDKYGETPLHSLSGLEKKEYKGNDRDYFLKKVKEHIEIIKIFASAGADINSLNNRGETPIFYAAMKGNIDIFKALVKAGADVNIKAYDNRTILGTAEHYGNAQIVKLLTKGKRNLTDENLKKSQDSKNRGFKNCMEGFLSDAIKEFSEAIKLDSNNADLYLNRGMTYLNPGQCQNLDIAFDDLNKTITLDPNISDAYKYRGMTYCMLGKFEQSIKDLNIAIKMNPNDWISYNSRGTIYYLELKQYDKAKKDFEKVLELNPTNKEIHFQVNKMLSEIG